MKAVVAIEPYTSLRDVARDGAGFVLGPAKILFNEGDINQCVNDAGKLAGFDPDEVDVIRAIQQTRAPVLLIHSKSDEFIPWKQTQRLHDAAADHSKLVLVDGNSHFDIWLKSFELINRESLEWFGKNLIDEKDNREGAKDAKEDAKAEPKI